MTHNMSVQQIPLTLIVAATTKNGIGMNGALPWPMLKKEMAYFARVTKRIPVPSNTGSLQSDALKRANLESSQRNVVIMGRKTWESIPLKFRPLKDRTNIIISSRSRAEFGTLPDDVLVAPDILAGLGDLDSAVRTGSILPAGRAYVIGGASIYETALDLPQAKRILLTRIHKDFECDTFFPASLTEEGPSPSGWQRSSRDDLQAFVGEEIPSSYVEEGHGDGKISYEFQLFERP